MALNIQIVDQNDKRPKRRCWVPYLECMKRQEELQQCPKLRGCGRLVQAWHETSIRRLQAFECYTPRRLSSLIVAIGPSIGCD